MKLMQQMTQETSMQFVDFSFLMPLYFFRKIFGETKKIIYLCSQILIHC